MARTTQRGLLLERIIQMMELPLRITKDETISPDSMILGIIYDLFELS